MLELTKRVQLLERWGKLGHRAPHMPLGAPTAPQGRGDPRIQHHLASKHQRDAKVVNPRRQQSGPVLQANGIQGSVVYTDWKARQDTACPALQLDKPAISSCPSSAIVLFACTSLDSWTSCVLNELRLPIFGRGWRWEGSLWCLYPRVQCLLSTQISDLPSISAYTPPPLVIHSVSIYQHLPWSSQGFDSKGTVRI